MGKIFNGEFAEALLNDKKYKQEKRDEKYSLSKKGKTNDDSNSSKPSAIRLDKNERTKTRKFGKTLTQSGKFRKSDGYFKKKAKKIGASEFSH
jgi:hypothetical protein